MLGILKSIYRCKVSCFLTDSAKIKYEPLYYIIVVVILSDFLWKVSVITVSLNEMSFTISTC